jgi:hypothetical protein
MQAAHACNAVVTRCTALLCTYQALLAVCKTSISTPAEEHAVCAALAVQVGDIGCYMCTFD